VTKRRELEAALAQAEAAREHLEGALAEAEAALINTVTDAARIDADRAEASVKVEKARARCRQLRAAIAEPGHADFIARSRDKIGTTITQPGAPPDRGSAVDTPPEQSGGHPLRRQGGRSLEGPRLQNKIHRVKTVFATSPHVRETIGLLSLVSAYLQYFYFDVQLQIMNLPSVTTLPLQ
jgi:membrane protein involved in colicin uptake